MGISKQEERNIGKGKGDETESDRDTEGDP